MSISSNDNIDLTISNANKELNAPNFFDEEIILNYNQSIISTFDETPIEAADSFDPSTALSFETREEIINGKLDLLESNLSIGYCEKNDQPSQISVDNIKDKVSTINSGHSFATETPLETSEAFFNSLKNQSLFKPVVLLLEDGSLTLNDLLSLTELELSEVLAGAISVSESTAKFIAKKFYSMMNKF